MAEQQKPEQKKAPTNLKEAIAASDLEAVERFIKDKDDLSKSQMDEHLASAVKIYGPTARKIVLTLLKANPWPADLTHLLIAAIDAGRLETTTMLLDQKADIQQNFTQTISSLYVVKHLTISPLDRAIQTGDADMVDLLLKKKAKIGNTSITSAIELGHANIVSILIQHDPKVIELPNDKKETPLIAALNRRQYDTACVLLEAKADLRKTATIGDTDRLRRADPSKSSRTALELIIESHPLQIERFSSVRPGAIQPTRDQWYNALYGAIIFDYRDTQKASEVSALLAAKASVFYAPAGRLPPLELAKQQDAHQLIIDIIQKKCQKIALFASLHPNLARAATAQATPSAPQTVYSTNPLSNAVARLDHAAAKKLLDAKANPDQVVDRQMAEKLDAEIPNSDLRYDPPHLLTWVASKPDIEAHPIVLELLKADEAKNAALTRRAIAVEEEDPAPSLCDSALAAAVKKGRTRITKALLEAKANPHDNATSKYSHLVIASAMGDKRMVQILLEHKASIDENAITHAIKNGHISVVEFLLSQSAPAIIDEFDLLKIAIREKQEAVAKVLIKNKADIEQITPRDPHKPLAIAARLGLISTVNFLLESKADVNGANPDGNTALHRVFSEGADKNSAGQIVKALLDAKANPNFLNSHNGSPLGHAVAGQLRPQPAAVAALVAAKAEIHYSLEGISVVEEAKIRCPDIVVEALLRPSLSMDPFLGMTTSSAPDKKSGPRVTPASVGSTRRGGAQLNPLAAAMRRSTIFDPHALRLTLSLAGVSPPQPCKSEPKSESRHGPGPS